MGSPPQTGETYSKTGLPTYRYMVVSPPIDISRKLNEKRGKSIAFMGKETL